jgi:putative ABC transport system permease protein
MIRHVFIAALRNMAASKLLSAISIFGLAVGLATAILAGLIVRNDLTHEHFLAGYERVYAPMGLARFGSTPQYFIFGDRRVAELIRTRIPEVEAVARVSEIGFKLSRGNVSAWELGAWSEPDLFRVLPFPVLHGDLDAALRRPDGVVLTQSLARKYFGRDNAVGEGITLDGHLMTVRAVIRDLPANATRFRGVYASGLAAFSHFAQEPPPRAGSIPFNTNLHIFLRFKPGAAPGAMPRTIEDAREEAVRGLIDTISPRHAKEARLMRIDRVHLNDGTNPGIRARLAVTAAIGLLTLFIAAANYINLMLVRLGRRQREVGLRKVCGAGRRALMAQFLGEAMVSVAVAALLGLVLVEWLLPAVNAFLQTGAKLDMGTGATDWGDSRQLLTLLAGVLLLGLGVGLYPALVLSGFKPVNVLKGWLQLARGAGAVRAVLVTAQFAILIVLVIAGLVVWRQHEYAAREAMRVDIDQMLVVDGQLPAAFVEETRKLPGVRAAAVSGAQILDQFFSFTQETRRGGKAMISPSPTDPALFTVYGVKPLAGMLPAKADSSSLVISQSAARAFGFATPSAAVGQVVLPSAENWASLRIVAVVPDFSLHTVETERVASVYPPLDANIGISMSNPTQLAHIRLHGRDIPETLKAIDRLWSATGGEGRINRFFLDAHMQERYLHLLRRAQLFAFFAAVAILLACLGLVGIAVGTADRRTKEIGVRKAMGATSPQVAALLLWQFSRPVLLANLIAWPVAWWAMQRWLTGFSYHVELGPAPFLVAGAFSLIVAVLTVLGQAMIVARQKPVVALRYE